MRAILESAEGIRALSRDSGRLAWKDSRDEGKQGWEADWLGLTPNRENMAVWKLASDMAWLLRVFHVAKFS